MRWGGALRPEENNRVLSPPPRAVLVQSADSGFGSKAPSMLVATTIATLPKHNQTAEAYRPLYRVLEHRPVHPGCQAIGMLWPSGAD